MSAEAAYHKLLVDLFYARHYSPSTMRMEIERIAEVLGDHGAIPADDPEMAQVYRERLNGRRIAAEQEARLTPEERSKRARQRAYIALDVRERRAFVGYVRRGDSLPHHLLATCKDLDLVAGLGVTDLGRAVANRLYEKMSRADREAYA